MKHRKVAPVVIALLAGGCSGGHSASANADWMDTATVLVAQNETTARETVTLVDPGSGTSQVMDDEALMLDVSEVFEP